MNIQLYIAMHKPYAVPGDAMYVPLQVGAAQHDPFLPVRDDQGENISGKNGTFCELTGLYWMRRHAQADAVGLAHYRRHFAGRGGGDVWDRVLTQEQAEALLAHHDVILPKKRHYVIETNWSQYAHAHYERDLVAAREVLAKLYPDCVPQFDALMKRRSGHRFNMFVMKKPLFDAYCDWLFPVLFELERRIDVTAYDSYNRRVFGFIGERLLDVWILHEQIDYAELPVIDMEPVNWLRKGGAFVARKLRAARCADGGLRKQS